MAKYYRLISALLLAAVSIAVAGAPASSDAGQNIAYNSAKTEVSAPVITAPAPRPTVTFSLQDSDVIAWNESGEGKYIYLTLSDEKNEELARITKEHLGETMELNLGENFIIIPEITDILDQKNGFVIYQPDEARRIELIHMMLGWPKKQKNGTEIDMGASLSGTADHTP